MNWRANAYTEDDVVALLQERALVADDLSEVGPELGLRLVGRGAVVRRRRRRAAAAGSVALVTAVVVGVVGLRAGTTTSAPTIPASSASSVDVTGPTPAPGGSTDAEVDPLVKVIRALPAGRPLLPALVPNRDGNRIVVTSPDGIVNLPAGMGSLYDPLRLASGEWAFAAHTDDYTGGGPDDGQELYLLRGTTLRTLHHGVFDGFAFSPDATRFVLAEGRTPNAVTPVRLVVRALDGTVEASVQGPGTAAVVGWTSAGIVVVAQGAGEEDASYYLWRPGQATLGKPLPYAAVLVAPGVPGNGPGRVTPATAYVQSRGDGCWQGLDAAGMSRAGRFGCGSSEAAPTVNPSGRYVVLASAESATVYDARDPRAAPRRLPLPRDGGPLFWEDDTHYVVQGVVTSYDDEVTPPVFARCSVATGTCEQAPRPPRFVPWHG